MTKKARYGILLLILLVVAVLALHTRSKNVLERPSFVLEPSTHKVSSEPTPSPILEKTWTLLVTGDVLTARTVNTRTLRSGDFRWPFLQVADELRNADLTFINLETPLVTGCRPRDDGMIFCGDPRHVEGFTFAGIDVVNIANNHAANQGLEGVDETDHLLTEAGFLVTGRDRDPVFTEVAGKKVAFLGFNEVDIQDGVSQAQYENVQKKIQFARERADLVFVQFHWGNEYTRTPSENQKKLAYLSIDAGADLVLGNHPHWWQPSELYKEKLIVYSHGNFVFDQMWSAETREGLVGKYTFQGNKLLEHEFLPVRIEDYGQPHWLKGEEKKHILQEFETERLKISQEK